MSALRSMFAGLLIALPLSATAETSAPNFPAPLEAAIEVAEAAKATPYLWAYDLELNLEGQDYRLRYDPRRTEDDGWSVLQPDPETLSEKQLKALSDLRTDDDDNDLFYDDLREDVRELGAAEETDAHWIYAFIPLGEDKKETEFLEDSEMTGRIFVSKETGAITSINMTIGKPFKPAPIAKIRDLEIIQTYAPIDGVDAPLIASVETKVSGSAMFQSFDEKEAVTFSNFERVRVDGQTEAGE